MSTHTPYQKHTWVTKEIIRREYLQNIEDGIYQEQQDAEAAETALENALEAEEQRARSSETTIQNNLTAEVTRATAAEEEITQGIQDDLDELSERISNEYTRATGAESDLHDYVDQKVATTYKASGSIYFADLPALTESRQGNVYNIKDAFITTADFAEGAGKSYPQGTNVAIVGIEEDGEVVYKYDVQAGFIDTSHFVSDTDYATTINAGIVKPDGTTVTVDANGVLSSTGSSVSPQGIGFGYGTCVTAAATTAKEASLTGYNLVKNGYVSIKFTNAVPASATLNINAKGAKPIFYHGAAITADIIGAGDLATFVYDGTNYNLVGVDNVSSQIQNLEDETSDIVNVLGAKNLLPYQAEGHVVNGINYGVYTGGILVEGTSATPSDSDFLLASNLTFPVGKYILSGAPSDSSMSTHYVYMTSSDGSPDIYDLGEGIEFTVSNINTKYSVHIMTKVGTGYSETQKFAVMIRPASTDDTFTFYAMTNRQLTEDTVDWNSLSDIGAVNSCPNELTTQTLNGLTATVNPDKSITVSASSYPFTVTTLTQFFLYTFTGKENFVGKRVKVSGCPDVNTNISLTFSSVLSVDGSSGTIIQSGGSPKIFTWVNNGSGTKAKVYLEFRIGSVLNSAITFKPMITVPSYNGDYVPYAMTNRELTEKKYYSSSEYITNANFTDNTTYTILKDGFYILQVQNNAQAQSSGADIRIFIGNVNTASITARTAYDRLIFNAPLKKGTSVKFQCTDATLSCNYRVTKMS